MLENGTMASPAPGPGRGKDASPNERQKKSTPVTNVTTATNST